MDCAVLLHRIFKDNLYNVDFQMWLVENLNLKDREQLVTFLSLAENTDSISVQGRRQMELDEHVNVYNFWKANSQASVCCSNNSHLVKISKENMTLNTKDIQDDSIKQIETKRGPKLQAHRKITMKSFKLLHESYQGLYQILRKLKPFYVSRPTEKETELCLCAKSLNLHSLFKTLSNIKNLELPSSLSDYPSKDMVCGKENETKYYKLDCILGKCDTKCQITDILKDLHPKITNIDKLLNYYMFESVETQYYNKKGQLQSYSRTARVDKRETIRFIAEKLQACVKDYLTHRFFYQ